MNTLIIIITTFCATLLIVQFIGYIYRSGYEDAMKKTLGSAVSLREFNNMGREEQKDHLLSELHTLEGTLPKEVIEQLRKDIESA